MQLGKWLMGGSGGFGAIFQEPGGWVVGVVDDLEVRGEMAPSSLPKIYQWAVIASKTDGILRLYSLEVHDEFLYQSPLTAFGAWIKV